MQFLFWACLASMLPGLLIRIPFGGGGILLADFLLPFFAGVWVLNQVIVERSFPRVKLVVPGFVFIIFACFSWILGAWDLELKAQILSFSYIIRMASILILSMAAYQQVVQRGLPHFETLLKNLIRIVLWIVLIGYIQFFLIPDIGGWSTVGGFDPHTGRLLGTWMDPNFVAGLLGFFLPLMIAQWYRQTQKRMKILQGLLIFFVLGALFLTFSRSGYLASIIGLGFFFMCRDPKIIILGIILATVGILTNERAAQRVDALWGTMKSIVLQQTDEIDITASHRIESWKGSLELVAKYPVVGIGYNTYRFRASEEGVVDENYFSSGGSDSTLLTILVTTGVGGFVIFVWFIGSLWCRHFYYYRRTKSVLQLGFVSGLSALLVHSVFVNSLIFPLIFMPVLVMAGILERFYEVRD